MWPFTAIEELVHSAPPPERLTLQRKILYYALMFVCCRKSSITLQFSDLQPKSKQQQAFLIHC